MTHEVKRRLSALTAAATAAACALALALTPATAAHAAAGTYTLLTLPDQGENQIYNFVNSAASSINLTIYELKDTTLTTDLVNREKAGVTVRVIMDRAHQSYDAAAYTALTSGGVSVVWSSASFVYTHQKTITVDGKTSFISTGNWDTTYYATSRDFGVFDTDASDVAAVTAVFNADFAHSSITPSDGDNLVWSPTDSQTRLLSIINGAQHTLDVEQEEFSDSTLINAIVADENRGVVVRAVLENENNTYASEISKVTGAGGKVTTYTSSTGYYIHAKAIVADYGTSSARAFQGSENFSNNSLGSNRELGLIVSDLGVVTGLESAFNADFNKTSSGNGSTVSVTDPGNQTTTVGAAQAANGVPRFDHVIVVMEENHSYSEVIGDTADAPYINNTLAAGGALFTNSFAIEHPSEPNYLDLFSGANQGVTSDACPQTFGTANEGAQLLAAGDTFAGYSEGLPSTGSTICTSGEYARKHVPWTNFTNVPASDSLPFSSFPSSADYASLPTVSWVIPNLLDDMHDGTIAQGDTWLSNNISAYATWAKTHNSLLVVTWDEDDSSQSNQIPTIFYGANVTAGQYGNTINHYNVLRTIEDMYGLPYAGAASSATPITNVWSTGTNTVTVTNPGNQTGTVGTAASLQVQAADSASGQTLTYSATGLPAGLSINASSGLISGTPTTAGTSNVTVSAKDTTGATGSVSFSWTVNPAPGFTISLSPTSGTVTAGSSASSTVSTSAVGGFSGTVSYSASGLPTGASASFSPTSGAAGSSSTLTLATSSTTPAGTYSITVTGTSGSLTHSATYSLTVNPIAGNTVTVTNPGNQTGTVGTAASLQVHASDSASGQTLTYSATGLPAGLSINASSGLISGTPTTAGTSNVTVTAKDTTGASGSVSFSWTVNSSGGGCTAAQLLGNPGFETGTAAPWTATSGVINNDSSEPPHSGGWDAWLDGYGTTHTDTLSQAVNIPSTCTTATVAFWLHIDTAETTTTTAYDKLNVQVLNSSGTVLATLATFSNLNHNSGYAQHSYSLAPYIGQSITLKFTGTEDSSLQTSFVVDDTALNVN